MPSKLSCSKNVGCVVAIKLAALSFIVVAMNGCRQATPIPAEIVGDSMAPLLCGQRISQTCPQCEISFEYGVGQRLKTIICPNCGEEFPPASTATKADQVTVLPNQAPHRWDVVAFEHGDNKTLVKRVLGLPGETVAVSNGEVFVNDKLICKPDSVFQQTKRLVFDSKFSCPQILASLKHEAGYWRNQEGVLFHPAAAGDRFDWISYRHHPKNSLRETLPPTKFPLIEDNDGFNQSLSRRPNIVRDLIVHFDLTLSANAEFRMIRVIDGMTYQVILSIDEDMQVCQFELSHGGTQQSFKSPCPSNSIDEVRSTVSFSNIDRKVRLVFNGKTIVEVAELSPEPEEQLRPNGQQPYLKFGVSRSSSGRVNRCRIWRDIFYFAEKGASMFLLPMELGPDEYFVVGDNVPVSRDSRHFGPVAKIIGTVDPLLKNQASDPK